MKKTYKHEKSSCLEWGLILNKRSYLNLQFKILDLSLEIDVSAKKYEGESPVLLRFINEERGKWVKWIDYSKDLKIIAVY